MTTGTAPSITLLGSPRLKIGASRVDLPDKLPGYLVAYLASRADWVLREELAVLLWPQAAEAEAQNNLRVNLARLRPHLADWRLGEAFVAERRRLRLDVATDVGALRAACARADWAAAASASASPFLDGMSFRAFAVMGEWASSERDTLRQLWRDALLRAAQGAPAQTRLDLSSRCLQVDAFDEELLRLQFDALAELGRSAEAQRVFAEVDKHMRVELGVGVSPALTEHVLRLSPDAAEAPAAGDPDDPLIGRDAELDRLGQQLQRTRLLTVLGLAGSGKTRLARAAQSRLAPAFDTRLWLPVSAACAVGDLVQRIADGLGLAPDAGRNAVATLAEHIGSRSLLLLVDGGEALLGDRAALQRLLTELLERCPKLAVVVTSREPMGHPQEALLHLGGLALPAADAGREALGADAVRLFVRQAQRVHPGFDPRAVVGDLTTIARRTGGLPLALRVAAGWTRFLSCADVAAAITRDLGALDPPDGDSPGLRAMLGFTWQRLSPAEQAALAQLSVFAGDFSLQAATEVAQTSLPVLGSLVDRSLVLTLPDADADADAGARRHFALHALVRRVAAAELARDWARQQAACARHADHLRHALARAEALRAQQPGAALARIGRLLPDFHLAWAWAVQHGQPGFLAATAPVMAGYCEVKGLYDEGVDWMAQGQAALDPERRADLAALAAVGGARARLLFRRGDQAGADTLAQQALAWARAVGHHGLVIDSLLTLGMVAGRGGDSEREIARFREARAIALDDGDGERAASIAGRMAVPLARLGRPGEAEAMWRESLAAERSGGRWLAAAQTAHNLARLLLESRRFGEALPLAEDALRLCDEHGLVSTRVPVLINLAHLHFEQGRAAPAVQLAELALAEARQHGERQMLTAALLELAEILLSVAQPEQALPHAREALRTAHVSGDRHNVLGALDVYAQWCARRGDTARAARVWHFVVEGAGASAGIREAGETHRRGAALPPEVLAAAQEPSQQADATTWVELALADYVAATG